MECYKAYKDGRSENDPTVGWFKGEIGFFDFYSKSISLRHAQCD